MADDSSWLPVVAWNDSYVEAAVVCAQKEVGKSVQKRRASKSKAVEQLAEKTIMFNESIASLSGEGFAVGDTEPGKADSKPGVQRKDVDDSKGQGKRQPEAKSEVNRKKKRRTDEAPSPTQPLPAAKRMKSALSASKEQLADRPSRRSGVSEKGACHNIVPDSAHQVQIEHCGSDNENKSRSKKNKKRKSASSDHVGHETEIDEGAQAASQAAMSGPSVADCARGDVTKPAEKKDGKKQRSRDPESASKRAEKAAPSLDQLPVLEQGERKGASGKPSALDKMKSHLQGGRFRMLNERLYTSNGDDAFQLMQATPELFSSYHEGFRVQAKAWSRNPVQLALKWLRTKPDGWKVADFGCGDAQIAQELCKTHTVLSFDLYSNNQHVTACNMANVPCPSGSCNAAIFSLALMGTDYGKFLSEAHRVLKPGGFLWIAEVRSRFVPDGEDAEDFTPFLGSLQKLGFKVLKQDVGNRMFVVWVAKKVKDDIDGSVVQWPLLKPCVYKRR